MKKITLFMAIVALYLQACKPKYADGVLPQIVGTWELTESKPTADSMWKPLPYKLNMVVVFNKDGSLVASKDLYFPFTGGWCNTANQYSIKNNIMYLKFEEPGCIPLINPNFGNEVKIISFGDNELILERGGLHKFVRI